MDIIERARARRSEIQASIELSQEELRKIDQFIAQAEEFERTTLLVQPIRANATAALAQTVGRMKTGEYLETVFAKGESLHYHKILERLLDLGWVGSGDSKRDAQNIYTIMTNQKKRYRKVGRGIFERVPRSARKTLV